MTKVSLYLICFLSCTSCAISLPIDPLGNGHTIAGADEAVQRKPSLNALTSFTPQPQPKPYSLGCLDWVNWIFLLD